MILPKREDVLGVRGFEGFARAVHRHKLWVIRDYSLSWIFQRLLLWKDIEEQK